MKKIMTLVLLGLLSLFADGPVLKTGQTTSYQTGDDGTYQTGIARSYTRDGATGIVTDNATGLMWQDDAIVATQKLNWTNAGTYCANLSLGGFDDWRLPSIKELRTLVDKGRINHAIDPTFQNIGSEYSYWSSTTCAWIPSYAWLISFYNGDDYTTNKSDSIYVRCVRGTPLTPPSFTRDNALETVYDSQNNLTWQDDATVSTQTRTWSDANTYCKDLNFAGVDDWRLPNSNELLSITDTSRVAPSIDPTFQSVALDYYWSSTTDAGYPSLAWNVGFAEGDDSGSNKGDLHYVRCVRGGQLVTSSSSSSSSSSVASSSSSSSSSSVSSVTSLKTGQTTSYQTGDDGTYQTGIARSYTRDNATGIVTDNATGLMWQDNAIGSTMDMNWTSAGSHCDTLLLGGFDDWRLPSISELRTLVDRSRTNPAINHTFQNFASNVYWSSTTVAGDEPSSAWSVSFNYGDDVWGGKSGSYYVRCVRGTPPTPPSFTRDNALETVHDSTTDLTWQDDATVSTQTRTWSDAITYCEDLNFAGQTDWRLPNINELFFIADTSRTNPAIDPTFTHVANGYWSSTTIVSFPSNAWRVYFNYGSGFWSGKSGSLYVRCVRGGQLVTSSSSSSSSSSVASSSSSSSVSSNSSSVASSSSVSSSSSSSNPNQVYASVQITEGWNLITVPFNTDEEFDVSSLIQNMATIGWKFKFIANNGDEYAWDKWQNGVSLKLKNGEGLFVGIPSTLLPRPSDYIQFQGIKNDTLLKFEDKTYIQNKWYLLGFGYEVKVSDILTHYPNAMIWSMENGAYKKLTTTDVIKLGQGFWFKY